MCKDGKSWTAIWNEGMLATRPLSTPQIIFNETKLQIIVNKIQVFFNEPRFGVLILTNNRLYRLMKSEQILFTKRTVKNTDLGKEHEQYKTRRWVMLAILHYPN